MEQNSKVEYNEQHYLAESIDYDYKNRAFFNLGSFRYNDVSRFVTEFKFDWSA